MKTADLVFPKHFTFDQLELSMSVKMAVTHQMILRYIAFYFSSLPSDSVSLLNHHLLVLLLKNKFLNCHSEDLVLKFCQQWLQGHPSLI